MIGSAAPKGGNYSKGLSLRTEAGGQKIYWTRSSLTYPEIQFKLTENYQCINGGFGMHPDNQRSPLEKPWERTYLPLCEQDTRFTRLINITLGELNTANKFAYSLGDPTA
jgi:hypothetical protein